MAREGGRVVLQSIFDSLDIAIGAWMGMTMRLSERMTYPSGCSPASIRRFVSSSSFSTCCFNSFSSFGSSHYNDPSINRQRRWVAIATVLTTVSRVAVLT